MTRPEQPEKLPRNIGLWGIWLLTVNGLIGAGIFGLPSGAASLAGGYSPAAFLVCALVILPVVLCFAEAGSYFRSTGGPIRYSTEAFGPFVGFQAGWLLYVSRLASLAANSVLLVDSVGFFWVGATAGTGRFAALASIWFSLVFVNVIGSVRAIRSLAVLTAAKLTALLLLVGVGIAYFGRDLLPNAQTEVPAAGEFAAATLLLIYAYAGFESVGIPAGETRRPSRDIPIALLLGLGSVALVYVAIQMVSIAAVPDIAASTSPLLDVANALMGPVGAFILMLGVVASVGRQPVGRDVFNSTFELCNRAGRQLAQVVQRRAPPVPDTRALDRALWIARLCACSLRFFHLASRGGRSIKAFCICRDLGVDSQAQETACRPRGIRPAGRLRCSSVSDCGMRLVVAAGQPQLVVGRGACHGAGFGSVCHRAPPE